MERSSFLESLASPLAGTYQGWAPFYSVRLQKVSLKLGGNEILQDASCGAHLKAQNSGDGGERIRS